MDGQAQLHEPRPFVVKKQKATTTTTTTTAKVSPTNALGTGLSSTLTVINFVGSILPGVHSAELLGLGYPTACLLGNSTSSRP